MLLIDEAVYIIYRFLEVLEVKYFLFADVAQLVEQRFRKAQAAGSSPVIGSIVFVYIKNIESKYKKNKTK